MSKLHDDARRLLQAHMHTTPGRWRKGQTTHDTVSDIPNQQVPYRIASFRHADDANYLDVAHEVGPDLARAILQDVLVPAGHLPCEQCGHVFDQGALGEVGCPNCHGEGPGPTDQPPVVVTGQRAGMATLAAGAEDSARLDWLAENTNLVRCIASQWYWRTKMDTTLRKAPSMRAAIDAARGKA